MTRPGVEVIQSSTPPLRSAPTNTGVAFIALPAQRGPLEPVRLRSMTDYARVFGNRQPSSLLYDTLDVAFREGLNEVYVARVVGPSAATAYIDLLDRESDPSLRIYARSTGAWGNNIRVTVSSGSSTGYKLTFEYTDDAGVRSIEEADNLVTQQDAVDWAAVSNLVTVELGSGDYEPRTAAATAMSGGDDDASNIRDREYESALARFSVTLGPGQVAIPGRTTRETYAMLLAHRAATGRAAVLDGVNTDSVTTLKAAVSGLRSLDGADNAALFAPWLEVPGVIAGTTRTVPPSALVLGRIAATDAHRGSANTPAAGLPDGVSRYALGVTQTYTDADFEDASLNGVNIIRDVYGGMTIFGWRSIVDPLVNDTWIQWSNGRFYMQLAALFDQVAMRHVHKVIDGGRVQIGKFHRDLVGVLLPFYESGDLYGETAEEAFIVDTTTPNPDESIARGELRATVMVRMSPFAEWVVINVNKAPIGEAI